MATVGDPNRIHGVARHPSSLKDAWRRMLYSDSNSAKVAPELMPVRLKVAGMGGMQAVELTTATRNRPRNPPATHKSSLRLEGWRAAPAAEFRIARNQMRRQIQRVGVSPDARGSA